MPGEGAPPHEPDCDEPLAEPGCVEDAFDLAGLNRENLGCRLSAPDLERHVEALLARLTLEQKIAQMHGASFDPRDELYTTCDEPALGIQGLRMVDGPRGVRAGLATTFPVALARGATWDPALEAEVALAMAREARARGANMLLAPAINLLRHPAWGRAQETYGEDPFHVGRMGAAFIAGAQREVIASVKHLALNSIEDTRFKVDVQVDERTLHEVYLPHFEYCVTAAKVGSVMTAYNRVNGTYCGENRALVRETLKGRWAFQGFVESDWVFGTRSTEASLEAGLDIEMPEAHHYGARLLKAVRGGRARLADIDEAVRRILRVKVAFGLAGHGRAQAAADQACVESSAHQDLALKVAHQSFVLLKNAGNVLPLFSEGEGLLAVVGSLAAQENTGDHGSSVVRSSFVISALEGIVDSVGAEQVLAITRDVLTTEDRAALQRCRAAIVVVGLSWRDEGERIPFLEGGGDRDHLGLPAPQARLAREVSSLVDKTVVVLEAGSALEVRDFVDHVPALLMAWYPGMLGGEALADVLFGTVNPSGKLPVSFPRAASDLVPFDHGSLSVQYELHHGYRQLERERHPPEFPFGFGLSYTRFRHERIHVSSAEWRAGEELEVAVWVRNVGERAGAEVVQLYLSCPQSRVERAPKVLCGFGRLSLSPGERKALRMRVGVRELRYYDASCHRFEVEPGEYLLRAGPSSQELPLEVRIQVHG